MNINEIVAMPLRIVTIEMALSGLDIGLTAIVYNVSPVDDPYRRHSLSLESLLPSLKDCISVFLIFASAPAAAIFCIVVTSIIVTHS